MAQTKSYKSIRSHDAFYDPSFYVGSNKDFLNQLLISKLTTNEYAVCPIFPSLFSDLRNYPRKQYVMRTNNNNAALSNKTSQRLIESTHNDIKSRSKVTVLGADRLKFFTSISNVKVVKEKEDIPCFYEEDSVGQKLKTVEDEKRVKIKNKSVQTLLRESSTQTAPWEPDYGNIRGDPELLKIDFLKWKSGLPAGKAEIDLIKKARHVRSVHDIIDHEVEDLNERIASIEKLARYQWIIREKEIEEIQNLRMELLQEMLNEIHQASDYRNKRRMKGFIDLKLKERDAKLKTINRNYRREMRRLEANHKGSLSKYHLPNVLEQHSNNASELYIPLIRHGSNPKYWHKVLSTNFAGHKSQFYGVDKYRTDPSWIKDATNLKSLKLPGTRLCIRETKWTEATLKKIHKELKDRISKEEGKAVNLRTRKEQKSSEGEILVDCKDAAEEKTNELSVYLQNILKGRSKQLRILEGRESCRELINELRSNFTLIKQENLTIKFNKDLAIDGQEEIKKCHRDVYLLESYLRKLGDNIVGTMLDFLNKEQRRLTDERKVHALVMLVEREKFKREAEESGCRQKEIRRRNEHDEIFKHVVKVHQETVDLYLQDLITEGLEFNSEEEAENYVNNLSQKLKEDETELKMSTGPDFNEEFIASQVHHFVIPEVQRKIRTAKESAREKVHLLNAHKEIYDTLDNLPEFYKERKIATKKSENDTSKSVKDVLVRKTTERDLIKGDIKNILNELVEETYKIGVLDALEPCHEDDEVSIDK